MVSFKRKRQEAEDEVWFIFGEGAGNVIASTPPSSPPRDTNSSDGLWSRSPVAPSSVNANEATSVTDPDLLDCSICFQPVPVVIYLCGNGHIACSSCCIKVLGKCPSCSLPTTFTRCRPMEKLVESVKVERQDKRGFGCKEALMYRTKAEDEKISPKSACFCPISSCGFADCAKNLYVHFNSEHTAYAHIFTYNSTFFLDIGGSEKYVILEESHEGVIFILRQNIRKFGRTLSVDCVGPTEFKNDFVYHLTVRCKDESFTLESLPEVHAKWKHDQRPSKSFLTIPFGSLKKTDRASAQLTIKKVHKI